MRYSPVFVILTLLLGTACSKKEKELPPLPPKPMSAPSGSEQLSEREQEMENMGAPEVSAEDRQAEKERAFRNLRALDRRNVMRPMSTGEDLYKKFKETNRPLPMGSLKGPSYELLTSQERGSLKAALSGCTKKHAKVMVTVDQKGKARLTEGQVLDTPLVECVAGRLSQLSFFEGKLRRGVVVLP